MPSERLLREARGWWLRIEDVESYEGRDLIIAYALADAERRGAEAMREAARDEVERLRVVVEGLRRDLAGYDEARDSLARMAVEVAAAREAGGCMRCGVAR